MIISLILLIIISSSLLINKVPIQKGGNSCECNNPYTTERIYSRLKGTFDSKFKEKEEKMESYPKKKKLQLIKKANLCAKLINAGFNKNWTYYDVKELSNSTEGRKKLLEIKSKIGKTVTNQDLEICFPGYLNNVYCPDLKNRNRQENQENQESQESRNSQESQENQENQESQDSQESRNSQESQERRHCHWPSIKRDIKNDVVTKYGNNNLNAVDFIIRRALLEFKHIMNIYQNKSKKKFKNFLSSKKNIDIEGLVVPLVNENYKIPWYIFEKYHLCFGNSSIISF